jgi:hypothetical protein
VSKFYHTILAKFLQVLSELRDQSASFFFLSVRNCISVRVIYCLQTWKWTPPWVLSRQNTRLNSKNSDFRLFKSKTWMASTSMFVNNILL